MKKYNIEIDLKGNLMKYPGCYFIDSLDSYNEYLIILNNKFLISESEIKNIQTFIGHGYSYLTGLSTLFCGTIEEKDKREPILLHLKYLQASVLIGQINSLLDGKKLVINDNGGYFTIKPDEKYKIFSIDNKYTIKDIKIKKWWGGKHYYAKVGNIDVKDDDGNVKWNTEQYAYDMSVKFMNFLNKDKIK
jgi:hypothetical protein